MADLEQDLGTARNGYEALLHGRTMMMMMMMMMIVMIVRVAYIDEHGQEDQSVEQEDEAGPRRQVVAGRGIIAVGALGQRHGGRGDGGIHDVVVGLQLSAVCSLAEIGWDQASGETSSA
jgi:hypothetical protein